MIQEYECKECNFKIKKKVVCNKCGNKLEKMEGDITLIKGEEREDYCAECLKTFTPDKTEKKEIKWGF